MYILLLSEVSIVVVFLNTMFKLLRTMPVVKRQKKPARPIATKSWASPL
jgi:hypothetical protein